jgi:ABC-2 type transport system ATP-binding protein
VLVGVGANVPSADVSGGAAVPPVVKVEHLTKAVAIKPAGWRDLWRSDLPHKTILSDVSFRIGAGECVALLGNNGAGKTTLMRSICGLIAPTHGEAEVFGHPSLLRRPAMLEQVGFMSAQKPLLWPEYRLEDSFRLLHTLYATSAETHAARLGQLAAHFDIAGLLDQAYTSLSFGQRAKAEILACLLHDPALLVLDEPTAGLDLPSQKALRSKIKEIVADSGKTVLLSSHSIADVADLCRRFLFLDEGRLVLDIGLDDLMAVYGQRQRLEMDGQLSPAALDSLAAAARPLVDRFEAAVDAAGQARISIVGTRAACLEAQRQVQAHLPQANARWGTLSIADAIEALITARGVIAR